MNNLHAIKLYNEIHHHLLNLRPAADSPELCNLIRKHVETGIFKSGVSEMILNHDYSAKRVLSLCQTLLDELGGENVPADWLNYIHQYALRQSFPHSATIVFSESLDLPCMFFLEILRLICKYQKSAFDGTWQSKYPMIYLTPEEERDLENPAEYRRFLKAYDTEYVYEMMKLNQEVTGHNTLDHICGVHFLALHVGRELKRLGLAVDLGRVSGAAAGHDIGKYGCKLNEYKRVPYLHYYYTDQWFKKHDITYIGHIAVNHSTWDLELENLPLESLILIYSDFRVKNRTDEKGKYAMHIFSLKDSFDVILDKLDNVDEAKEKRYRRVYAKLKDFEDYMVHLGVKVDIEEEGESFAAAMSKGKNHYSLMQGRSVIDHIKYLSIKHNIHLMHELRDEASLNLILESARSESDWKRLREYLRVFEEYSTYMTQKQKLITIKFLYDHLIHPEDDIRKHCAELIGILIAAFDEDYRKEVPQDVKLEAPALPSSELLDRYLQIFINPDHKIVPLHRSWIGYSISIMVSSLFSHCRPGQREGYKDILTKHYQSGAHQTDDTKLYLLETIKFIPLDADDPYQNIIYDYIIQMLDKHNHVLRLTALDITHNMLVNAKYKRSVLSKDFAENLQLIFTHKATRSLYPSENYLNLKIAILLKLDKSAIERYSSFCRKDTEKVSETFLSNLKSMTDWSVKKIQVEFLLDYALRNPETNGFYTAMHFCNLLKVSAVETVRNRAGEALIRIIPYLSFEQRNDVAVELLRALEVNGYQFAEYIPHYLGRILLYLPPIELDELIDDFIEKIKQSGPQLNSLILKTIGITVVNYERYQDIFDQSKEDYDNRLSRLIGILLNGLVHYDAHIRQVSFSVLGRDIFGVKSLSLERKHQLFQLTAKKILTLVSDVKHEELLFLTNSAALNHIYRFISDYIFFQGGIDLKYCDKVAFFPGTFDPFSLSHKEIAREIRNLGFEVYLAVDEFSWSKRTLPNLIRKSLINMSVADEPDIYLYPEDFPVNIANHEDLKRLKHNFSGSEVYIVVGSDVIANASSYQAEKKAYSIHSFSHIIFERKSLTSPSHSDDEMDSRVLNIDGKVIRLTLQPQYEDISSTQIRTYIDENRDISMLVDPLVQKYIYENGFYQREPQYKSHIQPISIDIEVVENINYALIHELCDVTETGYEDLIRKFNDFMFKNSRKIVLIRNAHGDHEVIGFSAFHHIHSSSLYQEFRNDIITEYIRKNAVGKMLVIDGVFTRKDVDYENMEQILLTETLAYCLTKDYDYCIFYDTFTEQPAYSVFELLELQGFKRISGLDPEKPVYVVNMSTPCSLDLNIESVIKEPFKSDPYVSKVIRHSRKRLQRTLTKIYPGNLLLPFDRNIMYETLIKKICRENNVPPITVSPRSLGPAMCVPYGDILNKLLVPNTVTKALHTEKMFEPDMKSYGVGPFPYYLDLEAQMRMIKSFNRPIILVDDILDKGYRIKVLDPLLKKENIEVQKIIVGILSGRGKELMEIQNRSVDSAYFIPKLRKWFKEIAFYPFIGGDALWRGVTPQRNLLPSINMVLPYTSPTYLRDAPKEAVFNLSQVAIENAIDLLTVLEEEYEIRHERSLTLTLLGQVFSTPRCTEHGRNMYFDLNTAPSNFLKNDLELLKRLKYSIL